MSVEELRKSPTMAYLMDALEQGQDIGHYGRLTFAMAAHFFLDKHELLALLEKGKGADREDLMALVQEVDERDYNPPRRQQILDWQEQQDFPICPDADDPGACNLYQELDLPERVFEHIKEFRAEQFEQQEHAKQDS